ncbi:MAG: hypothetical protein R3B90_05960 [Planctomycetaceae bacterium]
MLTLQWGERLWALRNVLAGAGSPLDTVRTPTLSPPDDRAVPAATGGPGVGLGQCAVWPPERQRIGPARLIGSAGCESSRTCGGRSNPDARGDVTTGPEGEEQYARGERDGECDDDLSQQSSAAEHRDGAELEHQIGHGRQQDHAPGGVAVDVLLREHFGRRQRDRIDVGQP